MARHLETQRRRALDVVFEAEQKDILVPGLLRELLAERQEVSTAQVPIQAAGADLVNLVADHLYDLDGMIEDYSAWGLRRLASLDRCVLRLGLAEICFAGLQVAVAVKEYSAIVREVGDEKSIRFITAIFNRAGKEMKADAAEAVSAPEELTAADASALPEATSVSDSAMESSERSTDADVSARKPGSTEPSVSESTVSTSHDSSAGDGLGDAESNYSFVSSGDDANDELPVDQSIDEEK